MYILTNSDLIRTYCRRFTLKHFYAGERSVFSERFKVPLSLDAVSPLPPLKVSLLSYFLQCRILERLHAHFPAFQIHILYSYQQIDFIQYKI